MATFHAKFDLDDEVVIKSEVRPYSNTPVYTVTEVHFTKYGKFYTLKGSNGTITHNRINGSELLLKE